VKSVNLLLFTLATVEADDQCATVCAARPSNNASLLIG